MDNTSTALLVITPLFILATFLRNSLLNAAARTTVCALGFLYFTFLYVSQDGTEQSTFLGVLILSTIVGLVFNGIDIYKTYSYEKLPHGDIKIDVNSNHIDICSNCKYFKSTSSFCQRFYFNVKDYPERFKKQCDGKYFEKIDKKTEYLGFNLGAFFLTPLWLLFHGKIGTGLLVILFSVIAQGADVFGARAVLFILIIQTIISLHFGAEGNKIAWEKKGYTSLQQLRQKQRVWKIAGMLIGIIFLLPIYLYTLYFLFETW